MKGRSGIPRPNTAQSIEIKHSVPVQNQFLISAILVQSLVLSSTFLAQGKPQHLPNGKFFMWKRILNLQPIHCQIQVIGECRSDPLSSETNQLFLPSEAQIAGSKRRALLWNYRHPWKKAIWYLAQCANGQCEHKNHYWKEVAGSDNITILNTSPWENTWHKL